MSPQEVIGACTEELEQRWSRIDASMRERMMQDYQIEDDALVPFLDTARLEKWHQQALELAKQDFRNEIGAVTSEGSTGNKEAENMLEELEKSIRENEKERAEGMLLSRPRFNGKGRLEAGASLRGSVRGSGSVGGGSRKGSFRSSAKLF